MKSSHSQNNGKIEMWIWKKGINRGWRRRRAVYTCAVKLIHFLWKISWEPHRCTDFVSVNLTFSKEKLFLFFFCAEEKKIKFIYLNLHKCIFASHKCNRLFTSTNCLRVARPSQTHSVFRCQVWLFDELISIFCFSISFFLFGSFVNRSRST